MVHFKEKKKKVGKKNRKRQNKTTLDHKHNEVLNSIVGREKEIPNLEKKIKSLEKNLAKYQNIPSSSLNESELEEKLNITEEIENINKDLYNLRNSQDKNDYLLNTSLMLYHYFDEDSVYVDSQVRKSKSNKSSTRKTVLDFFSSNKKKESPKKLPKKPKDEEVKTIFIDKKSFLKAWAT